MAIEIGSVYVAVLPSTKGFSRQFEKGIAPQMKNIEAGGGKAAKGWSSSFASGLKKWGKRGLVGAGVAVGGVVATALTKGFQRNIKIENAEATLRGLGYNEKDIKKISDQALAAVKGTAFGMDEAITVSSGALAAGVTDVEGYLSSIADVSTITGKSMEETGAIFNKIQANNRLSAEEMNQLADAGIPVLQRIQEEYNVTAEEARKMVSEGKINAQDFLGLMEEYDGAAAASADTTQGAFKNMNAALARFGQMLLEQIFPLIKPLFQSITTGLDWATTAFAPFVEQFSHFAGNVLSNVGAGIMGFIKGVQEGHGWGGKFANILRDIRDGFTAAFDYVNTNVRPAIEGFIEGFKEGHGWGGLVKDMLFSLKDGFMAVFGFIKDNWKTVAGFLAGIGAAFAVVKTWGPMIAKVAGLWSKFKLVLLALVSPVSLVVVAIGALVAGIIYAWNNHEGFRNFVMDAWDRIKEAAQTFVGWFMDTALPALLGAWDSLKEMFNNFAEIVMDAWTEKIQPALAALWTSIRDNLIPTLLGLWENVVKPTFTLIGEFALNMWNNFIKPALTALVDFVMNQLIPNLLWLWSDVVLPVFSKVGQLVQSVWKNVIQPNLKLLMDFISKILAPVILWLWKNVVVPAFEAIAAIIKWAWNNIIKPVFDKLVDFISNTLLPRFGNIQSTWETVWDAVKTAIDTGWGFIKGIFDKFKEGLTGLRSAFTTLKDGIKRIWDGLVSVVANPINTVIGFINKAFIGGLNKLFGMIRDVGIPIPMSWNIGEIPTIPVPKVGGGGKTKDGRSIALADGGNVPGYSAHARADNIPAMLTAGEYVLPVKATERLRRMLGLGGLESLRQGRLPAYADGGPVGGGLGDIGSLIGKGAKWIKGTIDIFSNPFKWVRDKIKGLISGIADGTGMFGEIGLHALGMVPGKIAQFVKDKFFGNDDAGLPRGAGKGMPWESIWNIIQALIPGAVMTSNYRGNAITASGYPSYHGMGRAVDFVSPNMTAAWHMLRMTGLPWSELYFTPAGFMRQGRTVPRGMVAPITQKNHFDHVHAALAAGGFVPNLYDKGGAIQPGISLVANATRKPEQVLTAQQWEDLKAGSADNSTINIYGVNLDVADDVASTIRFEQRRTKRGKYYR